MKKIAYSVKMMRPGCVLIQAAMGCDPAVVRDFDSRHWIVGGEGCDDMAVYPVTDAQLERLVHMTRDRMSKG